MEVTTLIELAGIILGGGGIVGFIVGVCTIRWERMKAKAEAKKVNGEAHSAEYEGMKIEQDTYQEIIADLKEAWKEQKEYIGELKDERRQLRTERDSLREERDDLREEIDKLRKQQGILVGDIESLKKMVEALKPLICGRSNCEGREPDVIGLVSDDSFDVGAHPTNKSTGIRKPRTKKET